jgi:hypothetical protein
MDHAIDRRRSAEHPPARQGKLAAHMGFGFGGELPGKVGTAQRLEKPSGIRT